MIHADLIAFLILLEAAREQALEVGASRGEHDLVAFDYFVLIRERHITEFLGYEKLVHVAKELGHEVGRFE